MFCMPYVIGYKFKNIGTIPIPPDAEEGIIMDAFLEDIPGIFRQMQKYYRINKHQVEFLVITPHYVWILNDKGVFRESTSSDFDKTCMLDLEAQVSEIWRQVFGSQEDFDFEV